MCDEKEKDSAPKPTAVDDIQVKRGDTVTMDLTGEQLRRWRNINKKFESDEEEEAEPRDGVNRFS